MGNRHSTGPSRTIAPFIQIERLGHRVARRVRLLWGGRGTVYVEQRMDEYRGYWQAAAAQLGAEFRELTEDIWEARRGSASVRMSGHMISIDDPVTLKMAGDKLLGYRIATCKSVPIPDHLEFTLAGLHSAYDFLEHCGSPVVVKPSIGTSSAKGVTTQIYHRRQLRRAAIAASLHGDRILVERMIPAESCRLLFLDGELLHAVRRGGTRVRGDGIQSISRLLEKQGHIVDRLARLTLESAGFSSEYVPADGELVLTRNIPYSLTESSDLRTVYDEVITPLVCSAVVNDARKIIAGFGSRFAGLDIMTNDVTQPLLRNGGTFLEINTTPGIHHHYITSTWEPDLPVAVKVLQRLLSV